MQMLNVLNVRNFHFSKSTELIRLLDLKSSKVVGAVGDYAKTVICIDLAATYLGIPFDYVIDVNLIP